MATVHLKSACGGGVFEYSIPFDRFTFEKYVRRELYEVNADGSDIGPWGPRPIDAQPWYGSPAEQWREWVVTNHGATADEVAGLTGHQLEGRYLVAGGCDPAKRVA